MVLSKKILAQLEQKHNVKLTDRQAGFMDIMYGRYIRPDWRMQDFEWGMRIALLLYPAQKRPTGFVPPPSYEQLYLETLDDSLG